MLTCRRRGVLLVGRARFAIKSDGCRDDGVDSASVLQRSLRRRLASSNATSQSASNSSLLRWATACRRFLGRTWRCVEMSATGCTATVGFAANEEASPTVLIENRSALLAWRGHVPWHDHAAMRMRWQPQRSYINWWICNPLLVSQWAWAS
jgi:hypothetical protein